MTTKQPRLSLAYIETIPSGRDAKEPMPLVVVLHGRGADGGDLSDIAADIDGGRGYRFIFPNAPRHFEPAPGMSFGFSWFDGWPAEKGSFEASRSLLLRFYEELRDRYSVLPGKLALAGFSQGGMMALDTGFRLAEPPAAIVVMSGALYEDDPPSFAAKPPGGVLIIHGTEDEMIPVLAARRARRELEEAGLDPEYHEFAMGHHVSLESLAVVRGFLRRALEG